MNRRLWAAVVLIVLAAVAIGLYLQRNSDLAGTLRQALGGAPNAAPGAAAPGAAAGGPGGTDGSPGGGAGGRRAFDPNAAVPVLIAPARSGDIDIVLNALGTVTARNTATVKPRVDGQLVKINFREGQVVKAGDLLAQIDPRPFQVLLDQAVGQMVRDQALLDNAKLDSDRYRGLLSKDSIAKQQVDAQEALVRQYEGTVKADKGAVDNAKLQLSFTNITAPIGGRLGLRQVDLGNMVHASDTTGVVVITQTQPINAVFSIAADSIGPVFARLRDGDTLGVAAYDREGKVRLAAGKLLTVDNQIDTTTGTVKLKAEFANTDDALFPNQFVNVRLKVETRKDVTLIPVSAVQRGTPGTFVYVVNDEKTVGLRPVKLGPTSGESVSIVEGLQPGEQVVIDGADKLRQGSKVEVAQPEVRRTAPGGGAGAGKGERRRRQGQEPGADGGQRPAGTDATQRPAGADAAQKAPGAGAPPAAAEPSKAPAGGAKTGP